ncbi:MAG: TetR/AcrR family transcriptional regulator [Thermonemataceae bacterium]
MTEKQEKIVKAALTLFANEGYNATSTSKVAKKAGVSEGLIFRHYSSKEGLLEAIMQTAEARIEQLFTPILWEKDPKVLLRKAINVPFEVEKAEFDFWKLLFKLKWEKAYDNPEKMKPVLEALTRAFTQLGYATPAYEATLFEFYLDGIAAALIKEQVIDQVAFRAFMYKKYQL